jgi:transcriptional regulator GlxA family with amidase domain
MRTSSRPVALLLFDEVELLDVVAPAQALSLAGRQWNWRPFKLHAVSTSQRLIATRTQLAVSSEITLAECPPPEIIVVPGGYGARRALDDEALVGWLAEHGQRAEVLACVGYGALLLGKAGLLGDAEVSVPTDAVDLLKSIAPEARPDPARNTIDSGKITSARGGGAALQLGLNIVARCLGPKQASAVADQLAMEWDGAAPVRMRIDLPNG